MYEMMVMVMMMMSKRNNLISRVKLRVFVFGYYFQAHCRLQVMLSTNSPLSPLSRLHEWPRRLFPASEVVLKPPGFWRPEGCRHPGNFTMH